MTWKQKARYALQGIQPWCWFARRWGRIAVRVLWEPRDLWLGCYWHHCRTPRDHHSGVRVYLIAVPTIALRIDIEERRPGR